MSQIKMKQIESALKRLNEAAGTPIEAGTMTREHQLNPGNFHVEKGCGGYKLVQVARSGYTSDFLYTGHVKKNMVFELILAVIKGIELTELPIQHLEHYRTLCLSTAHIRVKDREVLGEMAGDCGMVMARDYGYFLKLYGNAESLPSYFTLKDGTKLLPSPELQTLLYWALDKGFRMIELDRDAPVVSTLPQFNW